MSELIISVSGLRGVIGETLTPEIAARYAVAFSSTLPPGPLVITRDSRPSGTLLADAIHSVLNATGRDTIDADIAATPTTGILIREHDAVGGIQISASHNPSPFNGMKLFSEQGRVITAKQGQTVLQNFHDQTISWVPYNQLGKRIECRNTSMTHLRAVLRTIDQEAISQRGFRVLLDANHGAGAILGDWLLSELGCEITIMGEKPNGRFLHTPEPTEENLQEIGKMVRELKTEVAFCQDPDADRVAVIDENGRYVGEEYTMALCLDHVLRTTKNRTGPIRRKEGPVVVNCATSRMNEDIAAKYGVSVFRSAVGEANVVDLMLEKAAIFGGEGNGGPIDPEVGFVRDSFVGIALILDAMASTGKTLAQLVDELPKYHLVKRKSSVQQKQVPDMLALVEKQFSHLPCDTLDGLRIDHGDAWVLLRGSNTEPIIRVFAEAPTLERANQLCDEIEKILV